MKLNIKFIENAVVESKRVLLRADLNVPLDGKSVRDDTRIKAVLPTIKHILRENGKLIIVSHLGRPKGKKVPALSLEPVALRLSELLNREVIFLPEHDPDTISVVVRGLKKGDVCMIENLRFHPGEKKGSRAFAKLLKEATLSDIYVNDAFGTCHRQDASVYALAFEFDLKDRFAGFCIKRELDFLYDYLNNPPRPFIVLVGGAKVSDKLMILKNLFSRCDAMAIGGAMAYTFLKACGKSIGKSPFESGMLEPAKELLELSRIRGKEIVLPSDHIIVRSIEDNKIMTTEGPDIPDDFLGVDVGPKTVERIEELVEGARTVFWNGPFGIFENRLFAKGTFKIAEILSRIKGITIVGGGDSSRAVHEAGYADKINHISTGGGAALEMVAGNTLPALVALSKARI